jgi:hypothetical protein
LEGFAILLFFVLIPVTAVVLLLSVLALAFYRPLGRAIRRRPKMARRMHLIIPIAVFCVVFFLLFAGAYMRGTYEQYWLNEPLCTAAGDGDRAEVERLLERGASPDAEGIDFIDRAIVVASSEGHRDIVALLVEHGADVNLRDSSGHTALYWARAKGYDDISQLLIQAGARDE